MLAMLPFRRLTAHNPPWVVAILLVIFVVGTLLFFTRKHLDGGQLIRLGADGRYYWAFLTSLTLDHDLDFTNQYANPRSGNYFHNGRTKTGYFANGASIGPALIWMPGFVVAHTVSRWVEPDEPDDGCTPLIEGLTLYTSFLCAYAAMLLVYLAARRRWGPGPALAGAVVGVVCGPVIHYALHQADYSHAPSAFAVVAMLYVWDAGRGARSRRGWMALGALIGLAMLMRAQNLVFALPALIEGAWTVVATARRDGPRAALRALVGPLLGLGAALVVFSPQLIAWEIIYGEIAVPGGNAYIRLDQSAWSETLFSSRNGLFPYAPAWAVGLLGLILVARRELTLVLYLAGTIAVVAYLNGAFWHWWGMGSFGGRRYDALVYAVALGTAAIVHAVVEGFARRPRLVAGLFVGTATTLAVLCTGAMAFDFESKIWSPQPPATRMFDYYANLGTRMARELFRYGNPMSWPAAWAFSWRTGAPASKYDEAVGPQLLDGYAPAYQPATPNIRGEIVFAAGSAEPFVVEGLGASRKLGNERVRAIVGPHARFLAPLNINTGATMQLVGAASAAGRLRVRWNGAVVAELDVTPGMRLAVSAQLPAESVIRGLNIVDVDVDGVPARAEAAVLTRAVFEAKVPVWQ